MTLAEREVQDLTVRGVLLFGHRGRDPFSRPTTCQRVLKIWRQEVPSC
jgi:hypothetical protein